MAQLLVSDELWKRVEPHLQVERPKPNGGRPRVSDRAALTGILFVLRSGMGWEHLPKEMNCGSGMTCWRRLRDWQASGVWQKIWHALLDELGESNRIAWSASLIDSCSTRALFGGRKQVQTLQIKGKTDRSVI